MKGDVILVAKPRNIRQSKSASSWDGTKFINDRPKSAFQTTVPAVSTDFEGKPSSASIQQRHTNKRGSGPILRSESDRIVPQTSAYLQWLRSQSANSAVGTSSNAPRYHDYEHERVAQSKSQSNLKSDSINTDLEGSRVSDVLDLRSTNDEENNSWAAEDHTRHSSSAAHSNDKNKVFAHRGQGNLHANMNNVSQRKYGDKSSSVSTHNKGQMKNVRPTTAPIRR